MNSYEIIERLSSVLIALNNIEVKGEANLGNLSGSIAVIKELCQDITKAQQEKQDSAPENPSNTK